MAGDIPLKVSVAMITYNHERFLAQAIESVLAQQVNFSYEIVIGEDCSTDGTRGVILDFQRRYPERTVPILRDRNVGAIRNFVETIAACRGQYVAFLEGDDYWTEVDKLQMQVDLLDGLPDRALCCHRVKTVNEAGSEEFDFFPPRAAGTYTLEDLLKGNFVMTCSTVLRRGSIGPLPRWFFKMKLGDWPLFALVARHGRIELMDEVMAAYRMHAGSTWSSLPQVARIRETAGMLRALDKELDFRYTSTIVETAARPYLDLAIKARIDGSQIETGAYLLHYLRNGGWRLPASRRLLGGLAAYALIGSGYKIFSRAKAANGK